jgi:hypothetical protein
MDANETAVRERAYELWDHAGRPNGRSDEFCFAAKAELERKEGTRERGSCAPVRRRRERLLIWGRGSVPRGFEMLAARRARMKDGPWRRWLSAEQETTQHLPALPFDFASAAGASAFETCLAQRD